MAHARKRAHRRPVLGYGRSRSLPPARTVLAPPPPPPPPPQTIISAMNRRGDVLNIGENKLAGVSTRKHAARQQDGKGFTAVTDNATNANADADVISEVEDDLGAFNANAAVAVVAGCGSVKTGNHGPARQGIASPGVVARPRGGESTGAPPPHCSTSRSQPQTHSPPPPPPWARVAQLRTRLRSPSGRSSSHRCKISATKKNAAWRRENRRDCTTGRYNPIGMSTPMEVAVAHPTESVHVQAVSKSRGPPPETAAAEASTTAMQTQVSVVESANTGSPAAVVGDPEQVRQGKNNSSGDMSTSTGVRAKLISDSGYISSKAGILEHAANGGISGGTDHGSKGKRGKSPDRMSVIRQRSADPPDGVRSDGGCGLEKWVGLTNRLKTVQQSVCRPRGSEQEPAGYPGHCDISDGKALLACTKHAAGMSSASGRIFTSTGGAAELETSNWLQWDPATRQGTHRARDDLWGSGLTERIGAAKADLSQTSGTVQLSTTRADGMEISVPTPERTTSRFGQQQKLPSFRPSTGDNFGGGAAASGPDDNSLRPNDVGLFFRIPSDPQNISSSLPVIRPHRDIARNDVVSVADRSSGNMSALHDRNLVGGLPLDLARSPLPSDPFRRDAGTDLTPLFVQS